MATARRARTAKRKAHLCELRVVADVTPGAVDLRGGRDRIGQEDVRRIVDRRPRPDPARRAFLVGQEPAFVAHDAFPRASSALRNTGPRIPNGSAGAFTPFGTRTFARKSADGCV